MRSGRPPAQKLGYIPADTKLTTRPDSLASWDDIPESDKPFQRRLMEVFAGFCEQTDHEVGRILDELEPQGMRELARGGFEPDYFSVRRTLDLLPPREGDRELVILSAARLGKVRLIDNLRVTLATN